MDDRLSPITICALTIRNRGVDIPDCGLSVGSSHDVDKAGREGMIARAPKGDVMEVKGPCRDARQIARAQQVRKNLPRYGKVLVTTPREFLLEISIRAASSLGENCLPSLMMRRVLGQRKGRVYHPENWKGIIDLSPTLQQAIKWYFACL